MKKIKTKGFTLAELMVVIGIVGVLTIVLLGTFNGMQANRDKSLYLKTYMRLTTIVSTLANDSTAYPDKNSDIEELNYSYGDYPFYNLYVDGNKPYAKNAGLTTNGKHNSKPCNLIASMGYHIKSDNISCSDDNKVPVYNPKENPSFKTKDGAVFYIHTYTGEAAANASNGGYQANYRTVVFVDTNGSDKGPNCMYDATNCSEPDVYKFLITANGKVYPSDVMGLYYTKTKKKIQKDKYKREEALAKISTFIADNGNIDDNTSRFLLKPISREKMPAPENIETTFAAPNVTTDSNITFDDFEYIHDGDGNGGNESACEKQTIQNCKDYNTASTFPICPCKTCKDGYYLDSKNDVCILCPDGYVLIDGLCKPKTKVCSSINNCEIQNPYPDCSCTQCENGYNLVNGKCTPKEKTCTPIDYCKTQNGYPDCSCTQCISGYRLVNNGNKCEPIVSNPPPDNDDDDNDDDDDDENEPDEPQYCEAGFGRANCAALDNKQSYDDWPACPCKSCKANYKLNSSTGECEIDYCEPASRGDKCDYLDEKQYRSVWEQCPCKTCKEGYYVDDNGNCKPNACNTINNCADQNDPPNCKCTACNDGYELNNNTGKCDKINYCTPGNRTHCSTEDTTKRADEVSNCPCTKCEDGYELVNGNCDEIKINYCKPNMREHCLSEDTTELASEWPNCPCTKCADTHTLVNGNCEPGECKAIEHCTDQYAYPKCTCKTCYNSSYRNDGDKCVYQETCKKDEYCKERTPQCICTRCESGYVPDSNGICQYENLTQACSDLRDLCNGTRNWSDISVTYNTLTGLYNIKKSGYVTTYGPYNSPTYGNGMYYRYDVPLSVYSRNANSSAACTYTCRVYNNHDPW